MKLNALSITRWKHEDASIKDPVHLYYGVDLSQLSFFQVGPFVYPPQASHKRLPPCLPASHFAASSSSSSSSSRPHLAAAMPEDRARLLATLENTLASVVGNRPASLDPGGSIVLMCLAH